MGFAKKIRKRTNQVTALQERLIALLVEYKTWLDTQPKEERVALFNLARADKKIFPEAVAPLGFEGVRYLNKPVDLYKEGNLVTVLPQRYVKQTCLIVLSQRAITVFGAAKEPITINRQEILNSDDNGE